MNYTTLTGSETTTGSLKYWLNYSRIDADGILDEAEAWIYARLRVRKMLATADVSISLAASTATLPTGYLDPVHLCIPGYVERIRNIDVERFRTELGWDTSADLPEGPPQRWVDIDSQMNFDHKADQAYTAKMVYYKTPTALSSSNETNFLTDRYPTLLRRACLMFGGEARKEYDLMDRNTVAALEMIDEIKGEDDFGLRGLELDYNWEPAHGVV